MGSFIRVLLSLEYYITEWLVCKGGVLRQVVVDAEDEDAKDQKRPYPSDSGELDKGGLAFFE